ncbi:endo alpha-1,4 polygalactosaminidase [Brachybacterium sp. FME24]|uniref:endo alpha-1,4 polygalactosaminidase n=1 Tax=Brachybacterium sp. FME24 TaxID=2742605 RepID=UPI001865EE20|nr:endo alpha-1,4 polygalactosaminidase [Brachybacterium sp. FME24]
MRRPLRVALAACLVLGGCTTASDGPAVVALPPHEGGFDYQLGGAYAADVAVVVRDASADPQPGAYSICYVNGFQTQPDEAELWLDHSELLLRDDAGDPVTDPDWPEEYVLDPSAASQREGILEILGPVISGCAEAGFEAVEIDNLDTWTRFDGIDEDGASALAAEYVELSHSAGLAIAQKNAAEMAEHAHGELGFDFAVTEECGRYDECAAYTDVYGDHVLQIEYPGSLAESGVSFAEVCALPDRAPLTILRDSDLVAGGEPGYVYGSC